jgi:hypothetical protein
MRDNLQNNSALAAIGSYRAQFFYLYNVNVVYYLVGCKNGPPDGLNHDKDDILFLCCFHCYAILSRA